MFCWNQRIRISRFRICLQKWFVKHITDYLTKRCLLEYIRNNLLFCGDFWRNLYIGIGKKKLVQLLDFLVNIFLINSDHIRFCCHIFQEYVDILIFGNKRKK